MLRELFQYYTTPALPIAKKMGFLEESIAMAARHRRCYRSWQSHFERCQEAILQAVDQCQHRHTVMILGAGSLEDIPLSRLSQTFEKVLLVDLVFLNEARKTVKNFDNVALIELDVSNSLESAFHGSKVLKNTPSPLPEDEVSCVVSLNLVTQLPLIPVRWLMKNYDLSEQEADAYAKEMTNKHLAFMNQYEAVKCLIADREVQEYDNNNQLTDTFDPAWDVPLPETQQEWLWEVIPFGEVNSQFKQVNKVGVSIW